MLARIPAGIRDEGGLSRALPAVPGGGDALQISWVPEASNHDGFDGVHTVFGFIEDDRRRRLEHFLSHFERGFAELLEHVSVSDGKDVKGGERRNGR